MSFTPSVACEGSRNIHVPCEYSAVPVRYAGMATARIDLQRVRILDATAIVVAERGYEAATVADIVRAAGVSRSTFYEQFASKEACFLEAYERGTDRVDERIRA